MGLAYGLNKVEIAVNTIWEMKKDIFCICSITSKTEQEKKNAAGVVNNNYIMDVKTGVIRESKFWFDTKYNDYQIDTHYMGPNSMFRTYMFENGKVVRAPVYYINNETEEIVA